jgi:hypothetical protein
MCRTKLEIRYQYNSNTHIVVRKRLITSANSYSFRPAKSVQFDFFSVRLFEVFLIIKISIFIILYMHVMKICFIIIE